MTDRSVELRPCEGPCRGLCCCDCCGEAPGMHAAGWQYRPWQRWDDGSCCRRCCAEKPAACMYLQGKTRPEWMEEKNE